jgi:hypothetical protein
MSAGLDSFPDLVFHIYLLLDIVPAMLVGRFRGLGQPAVIGN